MQCLRDVLGGGGRDVGVQVPNPLRAGAGPQGRRTQQSLVLVSERQGKPWTWYICKTHTLMIQKHAFIMVIHPRQTLHTLPHLPGPRSV